MSKYTSDDLANAKGPVAEALANVAGYRRGIEQETAKMTPAIEALVKLTGVNGPFDFGELGVWEFRKMTGPGNAGKGYQATPWTPKSAL